MAAGGSAAAVLGAGTPGLWDAAREVCGRSLGPDGLCVSQRKPPTTASDTAAMARMSRDDTAKS